MLQIILALVLPLLQGNSLLDSSLENGHARHLQASYFGSAQFRPVQSGQMSMVRLGIGRLNRCDRAALATLLQATGSTGISDAFLCLLSDRVETKARVSSDSTEPKSEPISPEPPRLSDAHVAHCRTRAGPLASPQIASS